MINSRPPVVAVTSMMFATTLVVFPFTGHCNSVFEEIDNDKYPT